MFPYVLLKFAVSLDGCLDDASPQRLLLSNSRDFEAVDAERAAADAILVGANTVRRDNPRLRVRDARLIDARVHAARPPQPIRATWTRSGAVPADAAFFEGDDAARLVFCSAAAQSDLACRLADRAECLALPDREPVAHVLAVLAQRGVRRLLVEGGAKTLAEFLRSELADELQVSIAPFLVGDAGAIRWCPPGDYPQHPARRMRLDSLHRHDDLVALHYRIDAARPANESHAARDQRCMTIALREALRSTRVLHRFAVGCAIAAADGTVIATGYTGCGGETVHAEQAALDRAAREGHDLRSATLYSTLEPCARRASHPHSCVERILAARVGRVVYVLTEPPIFQPGGGAALLAAGGVKVEQCPEFAGAVRRVNDHLPGAAGSS